MAHRRPTNDKPKFMYDCLLCGTPFQFGPHRYDGKPVKAWDMMVCNGRISANYDGVVPTNHPHLIAHLEARGVKITLNAEGWIDWPNR
jgi:hypothetical protein